MAEQHSISIRDCPLTVLAERRDRSWGHAIDVNVIDAGGATRGKIVFACLPEFDDFDEFQAMSTEALITVVQERLDAALIADSCDAFEHGIKIVCRFNSPSQA